MSTLDDEVVFAKVTRVEVIEARGRSFVAYGYVPAGVTVGVQDDGRTLKVFAGARDDGFIFDQLLDNLENN